MIAGCFQTIHFSEHIVQVIQKFYEKLPVANGILGWYFNNEPLHFTYTAVYLTLIVIAWINFRKADETSRIVYSLLSFTLVFQSWHFVEHVDKLYQHFTIGCNFCPGIVGHYVDTTLLHFSYNLIVLVPVIIIIFIIQRQVTRIYNVWHFLFLQKNPQNYWGHRIYKQFIFILIFLGIYYLIKIILGLFETRSKNAYMI